MCCGVKSDYPASVPTQWLDEEETDQNPDYVDDTTEVEYLAQLE